MGWLDQLDQVLFGAGIGGTMGGAMGGVMPPGPPPGGISPMQAGPQPQLPPGGISPPPDVVAPVGPAPPPIRTGGIGSDAATSPTTQQPPWVTGQPDVGMAAAPTRSVSVAPPPPAPMQPPPPAPSPVMQPPPMMPQPGTPPLAPPTAPAPMPGHAAIGRMLGLNDPQTQNFFGGLGAGLKEAGRTANMPAGAAFLSPMGAAIEGTQTRADKRFEQESKAFHDDQARRKQAFDQSSTAFKDWLAGIHSNNETLMNAARSKYLGLKGQALLEGKTKSDWRNSPFGVVTTTEGLALKKEESERKAQQKMLELRGVPMDEAKIKAAGDAIRKPAYAAAKMNPAAVEKEMNRGLTQDNPFEPQDDAQLHEMVTPAVKNQQTGQWEGGWFKDPGSGKVLQFTKPDATKMPFQKKSDLGGSDEAEQMALTG